VGALSSSSVDNKERAKRYSPRVSMWRCTITNTSADSVADGGCF